MNYYREMGIYDFTGGQWKREVNWFCTQRLENLPLETYDSKNSGSIKYGPIEYDPSKNSSGKSNAYTRGAAAGDGDKPTALKLIREDIGDGTRCRLHKGRTTRVCGVGTVNADIMFIGEGPGSG